MTTSVPSFFSRDAILQRQARTLRSRKAAEALELASTRNKILNVILEEDESRLSSRSPSPNPSYSASTSAGGSQTFGIKARRRRANVSDIRIARDLATQDDDLSPLFDDLLSAPRAAPKPPTNSSPSDSPDSFKLTFTDVSFKFPHPPTPSPSSSKYYYDRSECNSPTSTSSLSSSPRSEAGGMPLTPSTSDDEESISSRTFNPRRAAIQPLVITKHNPRPSSPFDEISSISPSLLQPFKNTSEQGLGSLPIRSPLISAFLHDEYSEDSDQESDSEWYTREFSKILSLSSPIPTSFPSQHARPDSMSIPADTDLQRPSTRRRVSKALPPTPTTPSRRNSVRGPSEQLDPAFPSKRHSRTRSIPKYPPPPVPPVPLQYRSSVLSLVDFQLASPSPAPKSLGDDIPRPPPRSSVPADCDFEVDVGEDGDDSSSAFSFSMYEIDLDHCLDEDGPESPASAYSQPSFDDFSGQEVTFDLDYSLQLPLSLPTSPIDLEADINMGLEKLWTVEEEPVAQAQELTQEQEHQVTEDIPQPSRPQEVPNDVFSSKSTSSSFSFSPSPSPSPYHTGYPSPSPNHSPYHSEEKMLKSKWSTSTLASVREEHERRSPPSKLRLYFGGQSSSSPSPSKNGKRTSQSAKKGVPSTPTSPFSALISPRKTSSKGYASPSPTPASASPSARGRHFRGNSDVIVIGYGNNASGHGVRRRGSVSTVSDAGSDLSSSSTSSSGLRRKPIPVEMFLRSAA